MKTKILKTIKQRLEERTIRDYDADDPIGSITLTSPLLLRLLELAMEDIKDDVDLHKITEKALTLANDRVLDMNDYSTLLNVTSVKDVK